MYLLLCVCVCVRVSSHHSLLIRYGDVSMLQACMIKRSGMNVKPYRDQRKQSRKPSWQSVCVCMCVCESTITPSLAGMLSGCCGLSLSQAFLLY